MLILSIANQKIQQSICATHPSQFNNNALKGLKAKPQNQQLSLFTPCYDSSPELYFRPVPKEYSLGVRFQFCVQQGQHHWCHHFQFTEQEINDWYRHFEAIDWTLDLDSGGAPFEIQEINKLTEALVNQTLAGKGGVL